MAFPPTPVYPDAIDSDRTLYLVHDTAESQLCADNEPWSEEIVIVPRAADEPEVWADNGFANLDGELLYYDSVQRNGDGRVFKFKGCARNLGGTRTKFNPKSTWIRGFVVAEQHNQLVDGVLRVQNFVGYNFDPRHETLDWRIRNLQALDVTRDDYDCPEVEFTFLILENNPSTGILAQYSVQVSPPGNMTSYRLDFGDGQYTTTSMSGTHLYAQTASVDPVVTVVNDRCTVIQSAITRENPSEPPGITQNVFEVPIPEFPTIPDFTIVPCDVPEPELNIPTIMPPCFSFEGQTGSLPSVIIGPDINMVSVVTVVSPNPVYLPHSVVRIESDLNIPSMIFVDIPPTIVIDPPIPPTIVMITSNAASMTMGLNFTDVPNIQIDWGSPPSMEVAVAFAKQAKVKPVQQMAANPFGEEFSDLFQGPDTLQVEYETVGIPSVIEIVAPEIPPLQVDASSIPRIIEVREPNIPAEILVKTSGPLQSGVIHLESSVPERIELVHDLPERIDLVAVDVPRTIEVKPSEDLVELVGKFPDRIVLDAPKTIEVQGFPDFIPIKFPDEMPQIELVYRGAPIEMQLVVNPFDKTQAGEDAKGPCVMLVPCKP